MMTPTFRGKGGRRVGGHSLGFIILHIAAISFIHLITRAMLPEIKAT